MMRKSIYPRHWKKKMYLAKLIRTDELDENGNSIEGYADPLELEVNYQPLSDYNDIKEYGESRSSYMKAIVKVGDKAHDKFDLGDLVYLDGASPTKKPSWVNTPSESETFNGEYATHVVKQIRNYNLHQHIYFYQFKSTGVV